MSYRLVKKDDLVVTAETLRALVANGKIDMHQEIVAQLIYYLESEYVDMCFDEKLINNPLDAYERAMKAIV